AEDPAVVRRDPMAPGPVRKRRVVQRQHLRSAKQRQSPERQADVARSVNVQDVELLRAQGAIEVERRAQTDRGLEEAAAAAEGARAADANDAVLRVVGS